MDKTTKLSELQIKEALDIAYKANRLDAHYPTSFGNGFRAGVTFAESFNETNVKQLQEENERLREALEKVANWELPETLMFWDLEQKEPMSYEAAFGTNGSRKYFKNLAQKALSK